jgi:hypothetical protein
VFHSNSWCVECAGEVLCLPILEFGEPPECQTIGECVFLISCDIIKSCYQCEANPASEPVYIDKKDTCHCN